MHSGVIIHPPSQWCEYNDDLRCSQVELSSCVINTSIRSCIIIFGTLSEQIYQLTFYPFLFYVLIYMFMFLMYCDLHA